ncbi:MAG TPA: DUF4337 family protein [Opitutaceae bacterium]
MKITIPETLKGDLPLTLWGKILGATPIVMTVVATMLAGLASSEMTRAQYDRSWAAQMQSKAGDQWSFFQAKRLRGALQRNTLDLMHSTTEVRALSREALRAALAGTPAAAALESGGGRQALGALLEGELPKPAATRPIAAEVQAALHALEVSRPDGELVALLGQVDDATLAAELRHAQDQALAFDAATKPINQIVDTIERAVTAPGAEAGLRREFIATRLNYAALRYDAEARLNQVIGSLYELQVRKGNLSAERHHRRSQKFFYGMLAAQLGVIVATLAMAARKRNLLWSLAAAAGAAAISFAAYVYLYV